MKSESRLPILSRASGTKLFEFRFSNFGFLRRFRRRSASSIEQTAALTRAERLFEVNFRSTWTR